MNKIDFEKILVSNDIFEREKHFLIKDYSDLQSVIKALTEEEKIKFCYLYKKRTHQILYDSQETISIKKMKYNLKSYFYLSSIIEDNINIINYSYDFDLINEINSNNKNETSPLRILINSKIILLLINNFLQDDNEYEYNLEFVNEIKKENEVKITNNIAILHEFYLNEINLNKFENTNIVSLYIDIIDSLFLKNKFENYKYIDNIISQLDLDKISITKPMFDKLSEILNSNEPYLNFYKIKKIEDLFNKKIINFYFILFKYIFKKEILIYEFLWLLEVRKIIIIAIKNEEQKLFFTNLNDDDLIEKKEYILKFFTDSLYYYKKYRNVIKSKLSNILNYYQNFYYETKTDDIKSIQNIINTDNGNYEKYFNELDMALINKMNDRYEIIKLINNSKYKDQKNESNLQESTKTWEKIEKLINEKKIDQIESDYKKILANYFKEEKNKKIMLKIFNFDIYYLFLYNISNEEFQIIYYLFNKEDKYKDKDVIIQKKESKLEIIKQINYWKEIRNNIIQKKIKKIKNFIIDKLIIYFKDEKNNEILSKIFTPESIIFLKNYKDRKADKEKLNEILQYYRQYFPESKKDDINKIEQIKNNIFENIKYENYENYLQDYEDAKQMNIKAPIINYLIDPKNEGKKIEEEKIKKQMLQWNNLEKMLKDKKMKNIKKNYKKFIKDYFENKKNTEILLKIFNKEDIDYIIKNISEPLKDNIPSKFNKKNNNYINENMYISNNTDNNNGLKITQTNININKYELYDTLKNNLSTLKQTEDANKTKEIIQTEKTIEDNPNIVEKGDDIIKNDIKNKEIDNFIKQEMNIIKNILKKLIIKFNVYKKEGKNCIELNKIKYGKRLLKLNNYKWNKIFEKYKKYNISYEKEKQGQILNNFKKYIDFFDGIENEIKKKFKLDYKLEIELIFENIDNKENNEIYNITCTYIFYPPMKNPKEIIFKDNNILCDNKNYNPVFQNLLQEINNEKYINEKKNLNSIPVSKIDDSIVQNVYNLNETTYYRGKNHNVEQNNEYKVIIYNKIIGTHSEDKNVCTAEFIKELSNEYLISGGTDKSLIIYNKYDKEFKKKYKIEDIKEWVYSINERKNDNTLQIMASANKDLYLIELRYDKENDNFTTNLQKYEFPNMTNVCCIEMAKDNYASIGLYCSYYFYNLFNRKTDRVNHTPIINNKTFRPAIKVKENILALASNKVAVDGEDKLLFFNSNSKKISNEINNNYSFNFTVNGLSIIEIENDNFKNKFLLCACKKYFSDQKNGILLVYPQIEDKRQMFENFCDTDHFEVYCFCPITIVKTTEITENGKIDSKNSDFFFVGGFDNEKKEGKIRLYKIIFSEEKIKNKNEYLHDKSNTKIEYLQDIELYQEEQNKQKIKLAFEGPISCIIQIKNDKNNNPNKDRILATCYDGNVYSFSTPNLTFYDKDK